MERELLHNSIQCPDGTILVSRSQHNFVEHTQEDGRGYFVDGGLCYQRIGYSDEDYTDLCVYADDDHEKVREHFEWGRNFDKDMNRLPEVEYIKLKDITGEHLDAILDFIIGEDKIRKVFIDEKEYRNNN